MSPLLNSNSAADIASPPDRVDMYRAVGYVM